MAQRPPEGAKTTEMPARLGRKFMGVEFMGVEFMGVGHRAGRKTTEIPDRLDPPSRHKNYKHSGFAVVGCCWLVVVACEWPRGPLRGQTFSALRAAILLNSLSAVRILSISFDSHDASCARDAFW